LLNLDQNHNQREVSWKLSWSRSFPYTGNKSVDLPTAYLMEQLAATRSSTLRSRISGLEAELTKLKQELAQVEAETLTNYAHGEVIDAKVMSKLSLNGSSVTPEQTWPLSAEEYKRYGRQMIVPSVGIQGLRSISVLYFPAIADK
jgi:hypothetical protein